MVVPAIARLAKPLVASLLVGALMSAFPTGADIPGKSTLRPLTVDDVLGTAMLGDAKFSPDGTWLAYNLVPPYDQLADYSYWLYASALSGHQLWVMRPSRKDAPVLQPGLDLEASNYLVGFSPDSRFVVVLEHRRGVLRLVACRLGAAECNRLPSSPDIRDGNFVGAAWNERLVWTSDTTFVSPVRDAGPPGSGAYSRGQTGTFLWESWNDAWRGGVSTASEVVSTGRDRSEDLSPGELVEFNVETGVSKVLTHARLAGVRASPDGERLVAARVSERQRPPADAALTRPETHPLFDRRYAPVLLDAKTGALRSVEKIWSVDPHSFTWSADGKKFAVFGWAKGDPPHRGRFYVIETATLAGTPLNTSGLVLEPNDGRNWLDGFNWWPGPARTALLDAGLVAFARPSAGGEANWFLLSKDAKPINLTSGMSGVTGDLLFSDASAITTLTRSGPYRISGDGEQYSIASGASADWRTLRFTSRQKQSWVNEFRFSAAHLRAPLEPRDALVADENSAGGGRLLHVDYRKSDPALAWQAIALKNSAVLAASADGRTALVSMREGSETRLLLVEEGQVAPRELARLNTHLASISRPGTMLIDYSLRDPDGQEPPRAAHACLILPPDYQPYRRYPILVEIYPTASSGGCDTYLDAPRPGAVVKDLWASRGFIYVRPSIPLDLARTADGPIAGMPSLVEQSVDELVARGIADRERIVLFGLSQGGVSSLYVAAKSDRFAAIVSMNGWADFLSHYFGAHGINRYFHLGQNGGDNRWRYDCELEDADNYCPFGFGVTALDDPELYARSSPVAAARGVSAPVLLVHTDLDYFDIAQYDEMFGALDRAGKEVRYVRYWGEGHGLSSPANIRDLWRRIDDFLVEAGVTAQPGNGASGAPATISGPASAKD